ncbi:MAG: hypothetical protein U0Z75_05915 [Deinococcaceae bacterium]
MKYRYLFAIPFLSLAALSCNSLSPHSSTPPLSPSFYDPTTKQYWNYSPDTSLDFSPVSPSFSGPSPVLKSSQYADESIISGDGKFIIFTSRNQLNPKAQKDVLNVYRAPIDNEGKLGSIELVSFRPPNTLSISGCSSQSVSFDVPNSDSFGISSSYDGNVITFLSQASNLSPSLSCDTKTSTAKLTDKWTVPNTQAYRMDMSTSTLDLVSGVSVKDQAGKSPTFFSVSDVAVSGNGRIVAYSSPECGSLTPPKGSEVPYNKICAYDSTTGKVFNVSVPSPLKELNGHSISPVLSNKGNVIAFTSYANLIPDDKTIMPVDPNENTISNIYRIEFPLVGDAPDFTKVTSFKLMDADRDSTYGSGVFGSSNPTITANGRYVVFQSTKPPEKIVDGWKPNSATVIKDYAGVFIYMTDAITDKTSIISVSQSSEYKVKTFDYLNALGQDYSSFNPSVSPNGVYVTFTSNASDVYLNQDMKKYSKRMPAVGVSCSNLMFSSLEEQAVLFDPGTPQTTRTVEKGWKEVKNCLSALNPDTYGKTQVYLAEVSMASGVPEVKDILPTSITKPMVIGHFVTDPWKKRVTVGGTSILMGYWGEVKQVLYGDKNSFSGKQSTSDYGKRVFLSGAEDLYGSQFDMDKIKAKLKNSDGYYDYVPPADVAYVLKNPVLRYEAVGGYWWEPGNVYDPVGLYYDQKESGGYAPFVYTDGVWGFEK